MSSIKVSEIMSRRLITAGEGETLAAVAERMLSSRVSSVVVVSNGKVVGIVTEKDFVKFFTLRVSPDDVVKNHMTRSVITVSENTSVNEAKNIMASNRIRHLPVVDEKGRFVGMVTTRDIVEAVETLI
ncbi:MAG: CBS domain-containing protein [Candidatus Caldarchaeum sp.]|nr:CBS domain-containing protein [Candidatus Caldarchaeum sp.]